MSKKQKLLQRLLQGDADRGFGFDDLVTVLKQAGFTHDRTTGSHQIFKHPKLKDLANIQERKDGKAKPVQVKEIRKLIQRVNDLEREAAKHTEAK